MKNDKMVLDAKNLGLWESLSDEQKIDVLIRYVKEYNVDETYDHYILLTLAANGFLRIEYDRQLVDDSVLRHMDKENVTFFGEGDIVWKEKFEHSISIVHTVPLNHPLLPFVKYAQSNFVNNYTYSHDFYASKFEADFKLSYLLLLIGKKELRKNFRKIMIRSYTPMRNTTLFAITASRMKKYNEWEDFVIDFLDIRRGSILDAFAGIGTLSMRLDLNDVAYTAHIPEQEEYDLASMLFFSSPRLSKSYWQGQIQLSRTFSSIKGKTFDFIIVSLRERLPLFSKLSIDEILNLMSANGKALVIWDRDSFRELEFDKYLHLVESVILCKGDLAWSIIMLLNKNKELTDSVKVYDRTDWKRFTIGQLQESIHKQENLKIVSRQEIENMGGSFNIDIFKRNQYKPNTHKGDCLFRLSEFIKHVPLKEKTPNDIKLLPREIEGYSPLSPYINASQGVSSNGDARTYYVVDEKVIIVERTIEKSSYHPLIFDPREGKAGVSSVCCCFVVDEKKVNIDYLVYKMNDEYFLKQLFPHDGDNANCIEAKDILSCLILAPDGESSIEQQKQFIEDRRQEEIAEFAKKYGYDLGKFVQYGATDLPEGTALCEGKYTVLENGAISHGGFGKVYKAMNEETKKVVAIKEFFHNELQVREPQTNEVKVKFSEFDAIDLAKKKFCREIEKIRECEHENIVKVYEEFKENNTCYYAMEYVEGENLEEYCKKNPEFGECEALAITRQVAEALKAMHGKGYNHSDVKPKNILVDKIKQRAVLIDFGGAHRYENDEGNGLSKSDNSVVMRINSAGYTPEWAYDTQKFHAGRDIYSLGATLYCMLTKRSPLKMNRERKPDEISPKIWKAICRAMEKDSTKSLSNMDEFLALLPSDEEIKRNDSEEHDADETSRNTPAYIKSLSDDEVFVFGSNIDGIHAGGASRLAYDKWGAKWGVSVGPMGQTYAIPTVKVQNLDVIEAYVTQFVEYADVNYSTKFYVTEIGCGNAGFTPEQIAPFFKDCAEMPNVYLPESFWRVLREKGRAE